MAHGAFRSITRACSKITSRSDLREGVLVYSTTSVNEECTLARCLGGGSHKSLWHRVLPGLIF